MKYELIICYFYTKSVAQMLFKPVAEELEY